MSQDTYILDTRPGSLCNLSDIKILICYILDQIEDKLTKEQLNSVFQENEMVNYFNYCQAVFELKNSGHIVENKRENRPPILSLTPLGAETARELHSSLPSTALHRALRTTQKMLKEEKLLQGKQININKVDDGYIVQLKILDTGSDLLDIRLFAPDLKQAEQIADEFRYKTTDVYRGLLAILQNDFEGLSQTVKNIENMSPQAAFSKQSF